MLVLDHDLPPTDSLPRLRPRRPTGVHAPATAAAPHATHRGKHELVRRANDEYFQLPDLGLDTTSKRFSTYLAGSRAFCSPPIPSWRELPQREATQLDRSVHDLLLDEVPWRRDRPTTTRAADDLSGVVDADVVDDTSAPGVSVGSYGLGRGAGRRARPSVAHETAAVDRTDATPPYRLVHSFSVDALRETPGLGPSFVNRHTSLSSEAYRHLERVRLKPNSPRERQKYAEAVTQLRGSWRRVYATSSPVRRRLDSGAWTGRTRRSDDVV